MVEDDVSDERASVGRRLIIGGARSGKTAHALELAKSLATARGENVTYVATAQALDQEMQHRISLHRAERPATWRTLEAPTGLAQALRRSDGIVHPRDRLHDPVVIQRFVKGFSRGCTDRRAAGLGGRRADFLQWLQAVRSDVLLICHEVGAGIVPLSPVARRFQDEQGRLQSERWPRCRDGVTLVVRRNCGAHQDLPCRLIDDVTVFAQGVARTTSHGNRVQCPGCPATVSGASIKAPRGADHWAVEPGKVMRRHKPRARRPACRGRLRAAGGVLNEREFLQRRQVQAVPERGLSHRAVCSACRVPPCDRQSPPLSADCADCFFCMLSCLRRCRTMRRLR